MAHSKNSEDPPHFFKPLAKPTANLFTVPETPDSDLGKIDLELSADTAAFLSRRLGHEAKSLESIEDDFLDAQLPYKGRSISDHLGIILKDVIAQATATSSPRFIGHMTSALPQFLFPLAKLQTVLNQNVVKIETSGSFTPMERQVLAMLHHLIYAMPSDFYTQWSHNDQGALGVFCSGGTVANITALWSARNTGFAPSKDFKGVHQVGMAEAVRQSGYTGVAVLVSERGHYSLGKAVDVLGLGRESLISVAVDEENRMDIDELAEKCKTLSDKGIKILCIVGIAGSTETGSIDPLGQIAALARQYNAHFHVDAAWGGATLMSARGKALMTGVEFADSVTIDAHKQLYAPMGAGMVLFKNPELLNSIEHHANYILRRGSKDLGRHSLEGSRPGIAMLVHACLHIIGRQGYEALINHSLDLARKFAKTIQDHPEFELISEPQLCILTYRYVPSVLQHKMADAPAACLQEINKHLNDLTIDIQTNQREKGISFVSRTELKPARYQHQAIIVFRVVLANPLTTHDMLNEILNEQLAIACQLERKQNRLESFLSPHQVIA